MVGQIGWLELLLHSEVVLGCTHCASTQAQQSGQGLDVMATALESLLGLILKREIIFEHQSNPTSTQTHAIDAASGIEVVVTSPRHTRQQDQELLALKKLARTLVSAGILTVADSEIDSEGAQGQSGRRGQPTRGIIA